MDTDSEDVCEEEVLVYIEFKDNVNIEKYRNIHILGIDGKNPIVQMDDTFYIGKYESPFGTHMFFEEDPSPKTDDPLFDRLSEKNLKYVCKTRKCIQMQHAYVSPKEGEDYEPGSQSDPIDEDIKAVNFKTVQEAVNTFKTELRNKPPESLATKNRKRNTLEKCFQDINRNHVKIRTKEKKNNVEILFAALENLIDVMKSQNALFKHFKPKLEFLGSYFDRLRVKNPTEYDINLILTIPINYQKVTLDANESQDGYTHIIMPSEFRRLSQNSEASIKGFTETNNWCDKQHRLSVKKLRAWMHSVVDMALNNLPKLNETSVSANKFTILHKQSGPANTLTLKNEKQVIDIDLVPSLSFILPKEPSNSKIDFGKVRRTNIKQYFAVPKPSSDDYSWRLAFPLQERAILHNKQNLKSVLKLIKLLRDVQNLKQLSSYYIKTVFLWESTRKDDKFWGSNTLEYLILYMLKKFNEYFSTGRIPNFWCEEHNLLENVKRETITTWYNKFSFIVHSIERNRYINPEIVYTYFIEKVNKNEKS